MVVALEKIQAGDANMQVEIPGSFRPRVFGGERSAGGGLKRLANREAPGNSSCKRPARGGRRFKIELMSPTVSTISWCARAESRSTTCDLSIRSAWAWTWTWADLVQSQSGVRIRRDEPNNRGAAFGARADWDWGAADAGCVGSWAGIVFLLLLRLLLVPGLYGVAAAAN